MPSQDNDQLISDHNSIGMLLKMNEDIRMEFPFFNQMNAKDILKQNIDRFQTIMEMVEFSNNQIPSTKIVKFEIPSFQQQDEQYKLKLQKMLTEDKKKYHQIIKHTSNLGKQKQGMIINIMDQGNGQYITNYKQINSECVSQIVHISGKIQNQINRIWEYQEEILESNINKNGFENLEIPNLEVTPQQEKKKQNKINGYFKYNWPLRGDKYEFYNKAISYDWTHLSVIREMWEKSQRQDFSFMNLLNLKKLKYTLQMRIIPINKVSPHIPNKEQMRPIIVMSHIVKMIELFYEERLKNYVNLQINPEQIGFVKGMGTQIHIQEIIRHLKIKGLKGKTAIFIDLSNAYNVVNREKLYSILKDRKVFGVNALNFLFSLYDELYFWDEWKGEKVRIKNGLHQGSILSPYLFDIYFDDLIKEWKQKMIQQALIQKLKNKKYVEQQIRNVKILAYADDVVFLNNTDSSGISFQLFNEIAKEFNFQINLKKTNFLSQTKNQTLTQMGCNWAESYKYLGVWLNIRGSIKPHNQIMKKIVKKNSWRVKSLSKLLPARHIFKLWQIYVKPYFDYISTALWLQNQPIVKQFQSLWRNYIRIMSNLCKKKYHNGILQQLEKSLIIISLIYLNMNQCYVSYVKNPQQYNTQIPILEQIFIKQGGIYQAIQQMEECLIKLNKKFKIIMPLMFLNNQISQLKQFVKKEFIKKKKEKE